MKYRLEGAFKGGGSLKSCIGYFAVLCEKLCVFFAVNFLPQRIRKVYRKGPQRGFRIS